MITKIKKWGNSQGLRLTKDILADAQLNVGDEVEVIIEAEFNGPAWKPEKNKE